LVDEIILYYDARLKKHEIVDLSFLVSCWIWLVSVFLVLGGVILQTISRQQLKIFGLNVV